MNGTNDLLSSISYDKESGLFFWVKNYHSSKIGKPAGGIGPKGYRVIKFGGKLHSASRLAWTFVYGKIPDGMQIDHIDRNRSNDKISNLRVVTASQNCRNRKSTIGNFEPRYYTKHRTGKFQAQIRSKYIGLFDTEQEAREASLAEIAKEEMK